MVSKRKVSRNYTFTIGERAALQVLSNALQYVAERPTEADRDAAMMLWAARQRILNAAGSRTPNFRGLYRQSLRIVWRNPQLIYAKVRHLIPNWTH